MDICAAAFRFFAGQYLGKQFPLRFTMDRAKVEETDSFQIWEIKTSAESLFAGMPAVCHLLVTFGEEHARRVRENQAAIEASKPGVKILGSASWDAEEFSALLTADEKIPWEDGLFLSNLQ